MTDCPNCGEQVDENAPLCPKCGFDIHSGQADSVRRLREEGKIHPGRMGAQQRADEAGERTAPAHAADEGGRDPQDKPEHYDAGL